MSRESILAGWMVDGRGGPVREKVLISLHNGTIAEIEAAGPEKVSVQHLRDFSDCTLLPGLLDAHIHLFMSATENLDVRKRQLTLPYDDVKGGIDKRLGDLMTWGVVACRDGGDRHAYTMRYQREELHRGVFPVQVRVAGTAWHQRGRYGKMIGKSSNGSDTLCQSIKKKIGSGDHIKIVNSGLNSLIHFGNETSPQFDLKTLTAAVTLGKRHGRKTMVHANGRKPVEIALKAGCHSIEHGFFMGKENLKRMADLQIAWVPTAITMKAYHDTLRRRSTHRDQCLDEHPSKVQMGQMAQVAEKNLDHQLEQIHQARKLGVTIALGTDAGSVGVHHGRSVGEEMQLFMRAGYSVPEAIQCATQNNAQLLNLDDYGVIARGSLATFIAVSGPPCDLPDSLDRIVSMYILGSEYYTNGSNKL
jgi:imidazolonepropionase-like amidohydrolase